MSEMNWIAPTPRSRYYGRNTPPMITVSAKEGKVVNGKVKGPYFRLTANKQFIEKYYNTGKEHRIAFAINTKGFMFDPDPRKTTNHFTFNKARVINDRGLVLTMMDHFGVEMKENEIVSFKLYSKPFGTHSDKTISQLVKEL